MLHSIILQYVQVYLVRFKISWGIYACELDSKSKEEKQITRLSKATGNKAKSVYINSMPIPFFDDLPFEVKS